MLGEGQLVHVPNGTQGKEGFAATTQLEKWGKAGRAGFQIIPNVLFRAQSHLKIDCIDVVILLNLSMHWWGPHNLPYPSPQLLAQRVNLSRRTVERHLHDLEKKGLITRLPARAQQQGRPKVRCFDMSGLVERLESAASTNLSRRDAVKKSEAGYMLTG
jgi:DNA-binding transcriptional ArsR family regulator